MQQTIAFIGGGNMAGSLVGGLIKAGHSAARLRVAEPDAARATWLREQFHVEVKDTGAEIIAGSRALVLAVKPQVMAEALRGLKPDPGCTVISIAAGVRLATLQRTLGANVHYVRCMPNTPALYGVGISGLFAPEGTPDGARALAESILAAAGATVWLGSESELDAVTALSGSGPAYFFLLTEVLREAGVALGLERQTAERLAQQTFVGAARMIQDSAVDVAKLRAQVTSKGGTTEVAVEHLENAGLRAIFREALRKAAERARALGDALDKPH